MEIKDYNVFIDSQNVLDPPVKNDIGTYENICKTANGNGDNYTLNYLFDYTYIYEHYKLIATYPSKQQVLMQL